MKHYATDIIAEQVEFCGSKQTEGEPEKQSVINDIPVNTVATNSDDDLPF